jgi:hypothetical protein
MVISAIATHEMAVTRTVPSPKSKTRTNQLLLENSMGIAGFLMSGFTRIANLAEPAFSPKGTTETNICSVSEGPELTIEQQVSKSPALRLCQISK